MKKKDFTATKPQIIYKLYLFIIIFFILLQLFFTIIDGPQHPAMYVICIFFVITPCAFVMLWARLFKVSVNSDKITVRKGTGVTYSIHISEIVKMDQKIVYTKWGRMETITIRSNDRCFSIENLMEGFDKMSAYLLENVDSSKINTFTTTKI